MFRSVLCPASVTFAEFYTELQKREGLTPLTLVDPWPDDLVADVIKDVSDAVGSERIKDSPIVFRRDSTNQSIGNQVEEAVMPKLLKGLKNFALERCVGAGYPDQMLVRKGHRLAMEVKATATWDPDDSNRRVLTSSSAKLRKYFKTPIHHLLCTVLYQARKPEAQVKALRLDFLEPDSPVSVRLEVSVSHRLLSSGRHNFVTI